MRGRCTFCKKTKKLVFSPQDLWALGLSAGGVNGCCRSCRKKRIMDKICGYMFDMPSIYLCEAVTAIRGTYDEKMHKDPGFYDLYKPEIVKAARVICEKGRGFAILANSNRGNLSGVIRDRLREKFGAKFDEICSKANKRQKKEKKSIAEILAEGGFRHIDNAAGIPPAPREIRWNQPDPPQFINLVVGEAANYPRVAIEDLEAEGREFAPRGPLLELPGIISWDEEMWDGGYIRCAHRTRTHETKVVRMDRFGVYLQSWIESCVNGRRRGTVKEVL